MSHLNYYAFQARARGVASLDDIERAMQANAHVYDRIVRPWLPSDPSSPIAELACGHGSFLLWLKRRGFQNARGIDSSTEQALIARETECTVIQADALLWVSAQGPGSYAACVAIDFVEHVSKDAFVTLLEQTHRVLQPGGRLILRLPNGDSPLVGLNLFNDITHTWTYTSTCLTSLAQMTGFADVQFADEAIAAIRDHRWIKVPVARAARWLLGAAFRAAARHPVSSWSPHLWAALVKSG